ncbi:MAG: hypothetical protein UT32_C0020G0013 [Parcubacteria group bacterium GW2011_GWC2_39_14]|nr:MAG: hypothetical protein UT32_C0020G0013 [Parcubacteria group bacterium GW2011_GWC2_39_14]KKR54126.1 MAG: hypothetical protein UT91_C0020G0013 [Parcubacteria group bacterium GW2011_GWA2_40_23]
MSFVLKLWGGEEAMVVDDRVVTLFIVGAVQNPHEAYVTHIIQGETLETPDLRTLAHVRTYLKGEGYRCLNVACAREVITSFPELSSTPVTVTTAIEIWSKPEPKQKLAVQLPKMPLETEPGDPWHCPECDTFNPAEARDCERCDYLKPC